MVVVYPVDDSTIGAHAAIVIAEVTDVVVVSELAGRGTISSCSSIIPAAIVVTVVIIHPVVVTSGAPAAVVIARVTDVVDVMELWGTGSMVPAGPFVAHIVENKVWPFAMASIRVTEVVVGGIVMEVWIRISRHTGIVSILNLGWILSLVLGGHLHSGGGSEKTQNCKFHLCGIVYLLVFNINF